MVIMPEELSGTLVVVPFAQFLPCSQQDAVSHYLEKDSGVTLQLEHFNAH